jgi:hypothetical protein
MNIYKFEIFQSSKRIFFLKPEFSKFLFLERKMKMKKLKRKKQKKNISGLAHQKAVRRSNAVTRAHARELGASYIPIWSMCTHLKPSVGSWAWSITSHGESKLAISFLCAFTRTDVCFRAYLNKTGLCKK